jgi:NTE family protein
MSASSNKLVEVGVVLQGGGALGAYECGALNALLELMDEFEAQGRRIALKVVTLRAMPMPAHGSTRCGTI